MEPTEHHVFDLSTGDAVKLTDMLDQGKLKKEILANSSDAKAAKKAAPSSKIGVRIINIWLTQKGISVDIFVEVTPDDEYYCDGDNCFSTYTIPMAKAKEMAVAGSRLATALANF